MSRPGAESGLARALENGALALLVAGTALAPLAWGGFRPGPFGLLVASWWGSGLLGLLATVVAGRAPAVPRCLLLAAGLLLGAIGWAALRPAPAPADDFLPRHQERLADRWPQSVQVRDQHAGGAAAAGALLALVAAIDLACRRADARRWLAGAVVFGSAGTAAVGLAHNLFGIGTIYGEAARLPGRTFGPFFHHTAAGAQLNAGLPLAVALLALTIGAALTGWRHHSVPAAERGAPGGGDGCACNGDIGGLGGAAGLAGAAGVTAVALALVLVVLPVAGHAGNIARLPPVAGLLGMMVAIVLGLLLAGRAGLGAATKSPVRHRGIGWLAALVLAAVVLGACLIAATHRWDHAGQRWRDLWRTPNGTAVTRRAPPPVDEWERRLRADYIIPSDFRGIPGRDRGAAYATALRAIADRPLTGWGLGGWPVAASHHTGEPYLRTFFLYVQFVHSDLLQVAVTVGAPAALLVLGIAVGGWWPRRGGSARIDRETTWLRAGALGGAAAIGLQSLVDFPLQIPSVLAAGLVLCALGWATR